MLRDEGMTECECHNLIAIANAESKSDGTANSSSPGLGNYALCPDWRNSKADINMASVSWSTLKLVFVCLLSLLGMIGYLAALGHGPDYQFLLFGDAVVH